MPQVSVSVGHEGETVAWTVNGRRMKPFPWEVADDVCRALRTQSLRALRVSRGRGPGPGHSEVKVRWDGRDIGFRLEGEALVFIANGKMVFDIPAKAARKLWKATVAATRLAEEQAKAPAIAMDQAILFRAGAPFGLSSDPKIQAEAGKEAAWNTDLRRFIRGGIRSKRMLGAPVVRLETPKPDAEMRGLMARMAPSDRAAFENQLAGIPGAATT
jgi:hypothetical protein